MFRKTVPGIMLALLLIGILSSRINSLYSKPVSLNPWKENYSANFIEKSVWVKVHIPYGACSWQFEMPISSDIVVDAVYAIAKPLTKPVIVGLNYPTGIINPHITYHVTVNVTNKGEAGDVGVGIIVPSGCPLSVGGGGYFEFNEDETKTIDFEIENIGGLSEQKTFTLRVTVGNYETITDYKDFQLTLGPTSGVDKTSVTITVYDALSKNRLNGIEVKVRGEEGQVSVSGLTSGTGDSAGTVTLLLGYYTGKVYVTVKDPYGKYVNNQTYEINVKPGSNSKQIPMYHVGGETCNILQYLPYIVGSLVAASGIGIGAYLYKKRSEVRKGRH